MEYIYCKDSEKFEYAMRTLKRMGYENQIKHLPYPRAVNKLGVTIFVSDIFKVIGSCWRYGFAPYEYNCKPSRALERIQNHANEANNVSFNKFTNPINKIKDTGTWKELKKYLKTTPKSDLKTDFKPLDDKEELEQDREKLCKFAKDTKGKAKISLVPMQILTDVAEVREYGVKKYGSVDRAFEYDELDDCNEHEYLDHVKHVYAPDGGEETTYD